MDCEKYKQRLTEYIDNRLPRDQEAAVEQHVSECADCQTELDQLQRTVNAVSELDRQEAPAGFSDGVMAAIREQESVETAEAETDQSKVISLVPLFSGVAAAFLIALGIAYVLGPGMRRAAEPAAPRRMARVQDQAARQESLAEPEAEGTPPGMGGGYGGGGYEGGSGVPRGGYGGGGYGGGGYYGSRLGGLDRPQAQSEEARKQLQDGSQEKMQALSMPPRGARAKPAPRARSYSMAMKKHESAVQTAVFNQMAAPRAPESLMTSRPDNVVMVQAKEPLDAMRRVVNMANKRHVGVQLRFLPPSSRGRHEVELAMKVRPDVYKELAQELSQVFTLTREEFGGPQLGQVTELMAAQDALPDQSSGELAVAGGKVESEKARKEADAGQKAGETRDLAQHKEPEREDTEDQKTGKGEERPSARPKSINLVIRVVDESEQAGEKAGTPGAESSQQ